MDTDKKPAYAHFQLVTVDSEAEEDEEGVWALRQSDLNISLQMKVWARGDTAADTEKLATVHVFAFP